MSPAPSLPPAILALTSFAMQPLHALCHSPDLARLHLCHLLQLLHHSEVSHSAQARHATLFALDCSAACSCCVEQRQTVPTFCNVGRTRIRLKSTGEVFSLVPPNCKAHNVIVGRTWVDSAGDFTLLNATTGAKGSMYFTPCGWFGSGHHEVCHVCLV